MPSLSVIIPTHRRPAILAMCLTHLARQTIADDIEVIIINDDAKDQRTQEVLRRQFPVTIRSVSVDPCHQGEARNIGVKIASAPYILFIGDDILLHEQACEVHRRMHHAASSKEQMVLGHITWDPACGITPVMRWLERSGWQFGYPSLDRMRGSHSTLLIPRARQHLFAYASHISLQRDLAERFPFRTDLTLYGWEDIAWGMQLRDAGIPLVYAPAARALHHHHITLADSLQRMETLGRSARDLTGKIPGFDRVPKGWKKVAYTLSALLPTMAGRHRRKFLQGMR